jgi:hypothetical protein
MDPNAGINRISPEPLGDIFITMTNQDFITFALIYSAMFLAIYYSYDFKKKKK